MSMIATFCGDAVLMTCPKCRWQGTAGEARSWGVRRDGRYWHWLACRECVNGEGYPVSLEIVPDRRIHWKNHDYADMRVLCHASRVSPQYIACVEDAVTCSECLAKMVQLRETHTLYGEGDRFGVYSNGMQVL